MALAFLMSESDGVRQPKDKGHLFTGQKAMFELPRPPQRMDESGRSEDLDASPHESGCMNMVTDPFWRAQRKNVSAVIQQPVRRVYPCRSKVWLKRLLRHRPS